MQELFANEISFTHSALSEYANIKVLGEVYVRLRDLGITTCRISDDKINHIYSYLERDSRYRVFRDFLFAFFKAPYEDNDLVDTLSDEYLSHEWQYKGENCFGLAMAYLTDTISLSIDPSCWKETVNIFRDDDLICVRNISELLHVDYHREWFEGRKPIELISTSKSPLEKRLKLRDDHGKDVLTVFAKKLLRNKYVEEVVNSLRFNSFDRQFIRKINEDGTVECVLYWHDKGYGLAVKTTGRNMKETQAIAEILDKEYGHK